MEAQLSAECTESEVTRGDIDVLANAWRRPYANVCLEQRGMRTMTAPETCSCSGTVRASRWCSPWASSPCAHSSHWSRGSHVVTHSGLRSAQHVCH